MSLSKSEREQNQFHAFSIMLKELGDRSIDTAFFEPQSAPFAKTIVRTTWEELLRAGYVEMVGPSNYRLTSKGWLAGLELSKVSDSLEFQNKVGRVLAALKRHVKGRKDSAIVLMDELTKESGEAFGLLFNIIESGASRTGNTRTSAHWFNGEKGRLVEIPVDFNLEPIDIAKALTVEHLKTIEDLEEQLRIVESDRAEFRCPHCDSKMVGSAQQDFPEYHCIVTFEEFACGYVAADGAEDSPCPYGPNYPRLDEFDFHTREEGGMWSCYVVAKTVRARKVRVYRESALTEADALARAKSRIVPPQRNFSGDYGPPPKGSGL